MRSCHLETGSASAPVGGRGLFLGPSPCQRRLLQKQTGFPEPDQQALPPLLELEDFQVRGKERKKERQMKSEQGLTLQVPGASPSQAFCFTLSCGRCPPL